MFRIKRARSVIHSTAHHGVSALSYLHPRLGEECKAQGINEITYNFFSAKLITDDFVASKETEIAFTTLQSTFEEIAKSEELFLNDLNEAFISFGFYGAGWPNYCICSITNKSDKTIKIKVDSFGKKYGLLSKFYNLS